MLGLDAVHRTLRVAPSERFTPKPLHYTWLAPHPIPLADSALHREHYTSIPQPQDIGHCSEPLWVSCRIAPIFNETSRNLDIHSSCHGYSLGCFIVPSPTITRLLPASNGTCAQHTTRFNEMIWWLTTNLQGAIGPVNKRTILGLNKDMGGGLHMTYRIWKETQFKFLLHN